ncbi:hypothetical protein BST95_11620 [Halioglobus japonicus]|uniref:Uncharacterized protein n=1 Tax=Halioglobus japonicus TaxID=930805 RepID=A0AAP8SNT8_9GAMM|nr:hypothetical protein [Halioglobus japonicus]AQA18790.1 hypothetical protein BST95_11620 [Halioglobus japonicus]PLW86821.1 hypothetical protein C0029_10615 [Halioglobus japonicus]GHD23889.1 hypothetical protein GCM10007052_37070 [Halioglobus japonicus]
MNEALGSLKWIVGSIILFVGLYLGVEAYKSGESVLASLGVAGAGVVWLVVAGLLGGSASSGDGISQEESEYYRSSDEDSHHGDGWNV